MSLKPSINWLFAFIPITVALEHLGHFPAPVIFFSAALSIIPIASMIERSTGQLATHTGDSLGGLLSATFGNAPELIMALVALKAGYLDMVRATIVGTILANLLLVLGAAFLLGGLRHHDQDYSSSASRVYSSMMLIAVMSLAVPSAFSRILTPESMVRQEHLLNVGIVVVLFLAYLLYLLFMLKTHPDYFASVGAGDKSHDHGAAWGLGRSIGSLLGATVLVAWMSEILVGAAEGTGKVLGLSQTFMGIVFLSIIGGAAQSIPAVVMARKNKMDLTVSMLLGSCIQIVLFVAPVLVLASFFISPQPLMLSFNRLETGALFIGVLLATVVCGDGRSNWYKGVQLVTVYLIIALMFYFIPEVSK
jgi:Ca2+:H+ antiporter